MQEINNIIVNTAYKYIGEEEIPGNKGFKHPWFQEKMGERGWKTKMAWCVLVAELIWYESYEVYDASKLKLIDSLFSASAVETLNNFKKAGYQIWKIPEPGALVIWQTHKECVNEKGVKILKPHWTGHAGIVTKLEVNLNSMKFGTTEGNTNIKGSRKGDRFMEKMHDLKFNIHKGLVLKGFIYPEL